MLEYVLAFSLFLFFLVLIIAATQGDADYIEQMNEIIKIRNRRS